MLECRPLRFFMFETVPGYFTPNPLFGARYLGPAQLATGLRILAAHAVSFPQPTGEFPQPCRQLPRESRKLKTHSSMTRLSTWTPASLNAVPSDYIFARNPSSPPVPEALHVQQFVIGNVVVRPSSNASPAPPLGYGVPWGMHTSPHKQTIVHRP